MLILRIMLCIINIFIKYFKESAREIDKLGDKTLHNSEADNFRAVICKVIVTSTTMQQKSKKYPHITFEDGIWRGEKKVYPDAYFQVGKNLLTSLKRSPNLIGQIDYLTGKEDTFGMMMDRSIRCALWLKKQGIGHGDIISVSSHTHQDTIIPILASLYVGCSANTFLTRSVDEDLLSYSISFIEPKFIFCNGKTADLIHKCNQTHEKIAKIIVFENTPGFTTFEEILSQQTSMEVNNFECAHISSPEEIALVMFSSGSTGYPKAVEISYRYIVQSIDTWLPQNVLEHNIGTCCSKITWITSILTAFSAIIYGSTCVMHSDLEMFDFYKVIEKYKINWMMLGMQQINWLSKLENIRKFDFSSVKYIRYGGSRVKPEVEKNLHKAFPHTWLAQAYGMTEIGGVTTAMIDHVCPSVGIPMTNVEMRVLDSNGHTVTTPNKPGKICVLRTPMLKVTYYNNPVESEKVLDPNGWFHTGDLGYYDENGEFFITDRIKEIIKFENEGVPAGTIEDCIMQHPGIAEVAVVPKLHSEDVEQPIAFIVRKPNAQVTKEEIQTYVTGKLPDYMKLRGGVVFLDEMPYNESCKINKMKLRHLANNL